jgi:opacity protein-like surface antigen
MILGTTAVVLASLCMGPAANAASVHPDDPSCISDWNTTHSGGYITFTATITADPCGRSIDIYMICHDITTGVEWPEWSSTSSTVGKKLSGNCKGITSITLLAEVQVDVEGTEVNYVYYDQR